MRTLTTLECIETAGGISNKALELGAVALAGGTVASIVTYCLPSALHTAIGTTVLGLGGLIVCLPACPPVGPIVCGSAAGLFGYVTSSTLAPVMVFPAAAIGSAFLYIATH